MIKDRKTGPSNSIILKNKRLAIAVANTPWMIIDIIDLVPKFSNQNGSKINVNGNVIMTLAIVTPVAREMKLILGTSFEITALSA